LSYLYADTSALLRAYFPDEPGHAELRALLLEGSEPVGASELARVEFASAARAAVSAGRLRILEDLLDRFNAHCGPGGRIRLLALDAPAVFPRAYELVLQHRLRASDAIHLAVALEQYRPLAGDTDVIFVTRDEDQAAAALALGFAIR
jgi:hypothetical protein